MCVGHCGRHGVYGIKKDTLVSELMDGSVGIYGFFIRQMLFVERLMIHFSIVPQIAEP